VEAKSHPGVAPQPRTAKEFVGGSQVQNGHGASTGRHLGGAPLAPSPRSTFTPPWQTTLRGATKAEPPRLTTLLGTTLAEPPLGTASAEPP
jgi:hypothetical protein